MDCVCSAADDSPLRWGRQTCEHKFHKFNLGSTCRGSPASTVTPQKGVSFQVRLEHVLYNLCCCFSLLFVSVLTKVSHVWAGGGGVVWFPRAFFARALLGPLYTRTAAMSSTTGPHHARNRAIRERQAAGRAKAWAEVAWLARVDCAG